MTPSGRTYWWAKDAAWYRREHIVELGEEFGSAGPTVVDWLSCEAKAQNDGGWVKTGYKSVARGSFVDLVTVRHVVSRAVTLGLLDEFTEDEPRFTCRISGWAADQERAQASARKQRQRASIPEDTEVSGVVVTLGHGESRSVPDCPPTGQDRTGTEEELHPPTPRGGARQRDRLVFDEEVQAYTRALGIEHEEGWHNVRGAIESGKARTNDEVLAWVRKHRPDVLPQELVA